MTTEHTLVVEVVGATPLLMHATTALDPLEPLAREMAKLNSRPAKEKKTREHQEAMARLDWEAGLYWDKILGPHLPSDVIIATIRNAAKSQKLGAEITRSVSIEEDKVPIIYDGPRDIEGMWKARDRFSDRRPVVIGQAKTIRTRPVFFEWRATFTVIYDPEFVATDTLISILTTAGLRVGFADYRPRFGRFHIAKAA